MRVSRYAHTGFPVGGAVLQAYTYDGMSQPGYVIVLITAIIAFITLRIENVL